LNLAWRFAFSAGTIESERAALRGLRLLFVFFVFLKTEKRLGKHILLLQRG
jgi:hypothetical protein